MIAKECRIVSVTLADGSQVIKRTRNMMPVAVIGSYRNKPAEIISFHPDLTEGADAITRFYDRRWRGLCAVYVDSHQENISHCREDSVLQESPAKKIPGD